MNINVTYDSSIISNPNAAQIEEAIQAAVQFYEAAFIDNNITINIEFRYAPLSGGDAAENEFSYETFTYSQVVGALEAHGMSAIDAEAYATLPGTDPTGGSGDDYVLTTAQARALGLSTYTPTYDDIVTLNSNLTWDFDPYDRSVPGEYDAIGALEHEMSEGGLGRISSLGQAISGEYTPLDLFRYSSPGVRDFNPDDTDYFSINGTTLLTEFNNWATGNAKPADLGDWFPTIEGNSYGDSYEGVESRVNLTDLQEDSLLGWNLDTASDDLTHSGISDIMVDNGAGDLAAFLMNQSGQIQSVDNLTALPSGWAVVGTGDFNLDGSSDVLLESSAGNLAEFLMNSAGQIQSVVNLTTLASGWSVVGTGDFTGDGIADILLQSTAGNVAYFEMNTSGQIQSVVNLTTLASGWNVIGTGDFNGDGISDILLESASDNLAEFLMNDAGQIQSVVNLTTLAPGWSVAGIGDFTGSGIDDILLESSSGNLAEFQLNGSGQIQSVVNLTTLASGWQVAGIGQFTGNGIDDILLQSSTGNLAAFLLNGSGQIQSVANLTTLASGWNSINTHNTPIIA